MKGINEITLKRMEDLMKTINENALKRTAINEGIFKRIEGEILAIKTKVGA